MKRGLTGKYETVSTAGDKPCEAFIPNPLPPNPPVDVDSNLQKLMDHALLALGRLDSITTLLPDPSLFLYTYVRKEAVLSSQIEGTQSSLSDLLLYESGAAPGVPLTDTLEVSNYVAAMYYALDRMFKDQFPLSSRLLCEIHGVLLAKGRGSEMNPGKFRKHQNWVGGDNCQNAVYVPPPWQKVRDLIGDLENFLHDEKLGYNMLIKAALAHVQFETIHPFHDGNGRLGRLMIMLILMKEGAMGARMLYLSLYFKSKRRQYYDLLQKVRLEGAWEEWLIFFMIGVWETSDQAVQTAKKSVSIFNEDAEKIKVLGKPAGSALRVHDAMQKNPVMAIAKGVELTGLSFPTVKKSIDHLIKLGIAHEITGKQTKRLYSYHKYIQLLSEGTEPII